MIEPITLQIGGFERDEYPIVEPPRLLSSARIVWEGWRLPKAKRAAPTHVTSPSGRTAAIVIRLRLGGLDPPPAVEVDGVPQPGWPALKKAEWILPLVAVIRCFIGAAIGGLIGGAALVTCLRIPRQKLSVAWRWTATVTVMLLTWVLVFALFGIPGSWLGATLG